MIELLPGNGVDGSILDADALSRLRTLDPDGRKRLVERVLRAFVDSSLPLRTQLESAQPHAEPQSVFRVAHTLKSSSLSIGALRLAERCAAIEATIRDGRLEDLEAGLDAMKAELDAVLQALTDMLDASS